MSYERVGMILPADKKQEFKIQALHSTQISLTKIIDGVSMCKNAFGVKNPLSLKGMQEPQLNDISIDNIENSAKPFGNSTKKTENL